VIWTDHGEVFLFLYLVFVVAVGHHVFCKGAFEHSDQETTEKEEQEEPIATSPNKLLPERGYSGQPLGSHLCLYQKYERMADECTRFL